MILMLIFAGILWVRPQWGLLGAFAGALALLNALFGFFLNARHPDLQGLDPIVIVLATLVDVAIVVGIFAVIGSLIVYFRQRAERAKEAKLDADMAQVRAELAGRDGAPVEPRND